MFNSILSSGVTIENFAICLGIAFVLGLVVALTHYKTAKSSSGFIITLAIMPALVAMTIMLVNGYIDMGAGIVTVGIFSLVRFRSVQGNSRAILAIFFAMSIGLAVGTGYIAFASIYTVVISIMIFLLNAIHFGEGNLNEQRLTIVVPEDLDYDTAFDDILKNSTTKHQLVCVKTTNLGSLYKLEYLITLKKGVHEKTLIDKIRIKNGNLRVQLSHELVEEQL